MGKVGIKKGSFLDKLGLSSLIFCHKKKKEVDKTASLGLTIVLFSIDAFS